MEKVVIRKPYSGRVRLSVSTEGPSMTRQSEAAACDVNRIMAKYAKTGVLEHVRDVQGQYGNFLDAPSYQEACNQVIRAQEAFASLPAAIRKDFDNDPSLFLAFAQDPVNLDKMVEYGLATPRPVDSVAPAPASAPADDPA